MMKKFFPVLFFLGISQLYAETLVQVYFPSFCEFVSGKYPVFSSFKENEVEYDSLYNFPIEIRQTVAKFSFADLMFTGGLSFYFENKDLSSVNLSSGLTFGYGYHKNVDYFFVFRNTNITIYPIYEFPLAIFWKTPNFPWKFALDINFEIIKLKPVSFNIYLREIGLYTRKGPRLGLPDFGFTVGWVFNKTAKN